MLIQLSLQPTLGSNSSKLTDDIGQLLGRDVSREAIQELLRTRNVLVIPLPMLALALFAVQASGYHVGEHPRIITIPEGDTLEIVVPRAYRMSYVRNALLTTRGEVQWSSLINLLQGFSQPEPTPKIPTRTDIAIFSRLVISLFRNVSPQLLEACGLKGVEEVANRPIEEPAPEKPTSGDDQAAAATPETAAP